MSLLPSRQSPLLRRCEGRRDASRQHKPHGRPAVSSVHGSDRRPVHVLILLATSQGLHRPRPLTRYAKQQTAHPRKNGVSTLIPEIQAAFISRTERKPTVRKVLPAAQSDETLVASRVRRCKHGGNI